MIVVDSSAWIEFLRATGTAVARRVEELLVAGTRLAVTEVVVLEVLAGARSPAQAQALRDRLMAFRLLRLSGLPDFEAAAAMCRACRDAGETIRRTTDCLVAVPTIEARATLLHADRDFEILARHTPLRLEPAAA